MSSPNSGQTASQNSLYQLLQRSYQKDGLNKAHQYIPVDKFNELVSATNVRFELRSRKRRRFLRFLRVSKSGALAARIMESGRKLFVLFVHLSQPWEIRYLLDAGFTDDDLPFSKDEKHLISAKDAQKRFEWPEDWELPKLETLIEKQWIVQAPIFGSVGKHSVFDTKCPLPLSDVELERHGNHNIVYKARVHSAHHEGLKVVTPHLLVAIKKFSKDIDFQQERGNLDTIRSLSKTKHITQALETFEQSNENYIIFPWAEGGDLDNFWKTKDPEVRSPKLALWCLQQMLGLAEALQALHDDLKNGQNCRHGDLKPGNILHFDTDDTYGILKITDFGISRVHISATSSRLGMSTTTRMTTPSYQAPEADSTEPNTPRSRKFDMWSLGCIYLEFVIWAVRSWQAVEELGAQRKPPNPGSDSEAHFYQRATGGAVVHPAVEKAFLQLRDMPSCRPETAFGKLIDIIDQNLLQTIVKERLDAKPLCDKLVDIVTRSSQDNDFLGIATTRIQDD